MTATEPGTRRGIRRLTALGRRSRTLPGLDEQEGTETLAEAIAALPAGDWPYPQDAPPPSPVRLVGPSFRPARAAKTEPVPQLAEDTPRRQPAGHCAPPPADLPDLALLARVRSGLLRKSRAEAFLADKHGLPCFDAATRAVGWQGLHTQPGVLLHLHRRWTTDLWFAQELDANATALACARIAMLADVDAARARVFAPLDGGAR